jgi:hypothetical protein
MALTNLGFEDAGATPGSAAGWTIAVTATAERVALFGTEVPPRDHEDLEAEWSSNEDYEFALNELSILAPLLDTDVSEGEGVEDLEEGWSSNESYLFEMGSTGDLTPDGFEADWDNNSYDFVMGSAVSAFFDAAFAPQGYEDFEDGWRGTGVGNDYETVMGSTTAASFDGVLAPEDYEDFEEVRTEIQLTADPATDLLTAASNHLFGVGDRCSFRLAGSGALPAGLNGSYEYHVLAAGLTVTAFKVSVAAAGAAVDLTDAGAGVFYLVHDRERYWVITAP